MNYNVKGTSIEISGELRAYVEKKLASADKFLQGDATAHADVELEYQPNHDGPGKYCAEFTVRASGQTYRAAEWAGGLHEALDLAGEELAKELQRDKKKRLRVLRHSAVRVKEFLRGWRGKV